MNAGLLNLVWAGVCIVLIYVVHKNIEKYLALKSIEMIALSAEKISDAFVKILNETSVKEKILGSFHQLVDLQKDPRYNVRSHRYQHQ